MWAHLSPVLENYWIFLIFLYLVYICSAQMVMGDFFLEKFIFALFGQICVFGPLEAEKWPIGLLSLVLAENFLKFSPKCLLASVSSGIRWKIQNRGFFLRRRTF